MSRLQILKGGKGGGREGGKRERGRVLWELSGWEIVFG